jgi:hypothetical protein
MEKAGLANAALKEKHHPFLSSVFGAVRSVNQRIKDFVSEILIKTWKTAVIF